MLPCIEASKPNVMPLRLVATRRPYIQKMYDKLAAIEHSIDEEAQVGANLPFSIENPRALAFKMILFMGVALNIPFFITYYQMKAAKGG